MKVVISLGNPIKSDDNIANIIIDKINLKDVFKIKGGVNPENFIEKIKNYKKIIFLDALEFGGNVGEVRVFDLNDIKNVINSTHNISINLIKKLIPESEIKIIGIQHKKIEFGTELSKELKDKLEDITKAVEKLIKFL